MRVSASSFLPVATNWQQVGWHAGLFCVYLTSAEKRFLRFSEACDYYNLGLIAAAPLFCRLQNKMEWCGYFAIITSEKMNPISGCSHSIEQHNTKFRITRLFTMIWWRPDGSKKINNLIKDILRHGYQAEYGKVEMLKGNFFWICECSHW